MLKLWVLLLSAALAGCPGPPPAPEPLIPLTAEELAYVREHGAVTWAVEENRAPYVFVEENVARGLSLEYLQAIAQRTGLSFRPVRTDTAAKSRLAVQDGAVDLLVAAFPENGDGRLAFTPPFSRQGAVMIFVSEVKSRTPLAIAVGFNNPAKEYVAGRFPSGKFFETQDDEESFVLLHRRVVDAAVMDEGAANYWIKAGRLEAQKVHIQYEYPYAFGFSSRATVLGSIMTKALASLTPEERAALDARWVK